MLCKCGISVHVFKVRIFHNTPACLCSILTPKCRVSLPSTACRQPSTVAGSLGGDIALLLDGSRGKQQGASVLSRGRSPRWAREGEPDNQATRFFFHTKESVYFLTAFSLSSSYSLSRPLFHAHGEAERKTMCYQAFCKRAVVKTNHGEDTPRRALVAC